MPLGMKSGDYLLKHQRQAYFDVGYLVPGNYQEIQLFFFLWIWRWREDTVFGVKMIHGVGWGEPREGCRRACAWRGPAWASYKLHCLKKDLLSHLLQCSKAKQREIPSIIFWAKDSPPAPPPLQDAAMICLHRPETPSKYLMMVFHQRSQGVFDIMSILKVPCISLKINIKKLHRHSNICLSHGLRTHILREQHYLPPPPHVYQKKEYGVFSPPPSASGFRGLSSYHGSGDSHS